VTHAQNVHHGLAFFDPVDNSVGVWLPAKGVKERRISRPSWTARVSPKKRRPS